MYRIDKELLKAKIGSMEYKDKFSAHKSFEINDFNEIIGIIILKGYKMYDLGKYKRKVNSHQYAIQLIRKGKYLYFVCVCAYIKKGNPHILKKDLAEEELRILLSQIL